jgi:DNA-binding MarR family transcriptional regulator
MALRFPAARDADARRYRLSRSIGDTVAWLAPVFRAPFSELVSICTLTSSNCAVKLLRKSTNRSPDLNNHVRFGRLGLVIGYNFTHGYLKTLLTFDQVVQETGLQPSQFAVLSLVEATPGIKQTTLADVLSVDRSTMVRIVDRCEYAKWLRRGSSRVDRRVAPLELTPAGKALLDEIYPRLVRSEALVSTLTAAERRTFLRLLRKFNGILR